MCLACCVETPIFTPTLILFGQTFESPVRACNTGGFFYLSLTLLFQVNEKKRNSDSLRAQIEKYLANRKLAQASRDHTEHMWDLWPLVALETDPFKSSELKKHFCVQMVAYIQSEARSHLAQIVDKLESENKFTAYPKEPISWDVALAMKDRVFTTGDLYSHIVPLTNLAAIMRAFSDATGKKFRIDPPATSASRKETDYQILERLFLVRNQIAHESSVAVKIKDTDIYHFATSGFRLVGLMYAWLVFDDLDDNSVDSK